MRNIFEDTSMGSADRMTTSVGPGSTEAPFQHDRIPTQPNDPNAPQVLPFQIQDIIRNVGQKYVDFVELKNQLELAKSNPSVLEHKKHALDKMIIRVNKINKLIVGLPQLLDEFSE